MKAILHIGSGKTGSKSVQGFLRHNADYLKDKNYAQMFSTKVGNYDIGLGAYSGVGAWRKTCINKWGWDLPEDFDALFECKFREEFERLDAQCVIFSFEGLINLPIEKVKKIKVLLENFFDDFYIFAFARRQDRHAVSSYTTRLRNAGVSDRNILYSNTGDPRGIDYYEKFLNWSGCFGEDNVKFVDYELCEDVVECFTDHLNLPEGLRVPSDRANQSLSAFGQEVLRMFNEKLAEEPEYREVADKVRAVLKDYYIGEPLKPSRQDAEEMFRMYEQSNKALSEAMGSPRRNFFDEDFSEYPEIFSPRQLDFGRLKHYIDVALNESQR